MGEGVAGQRVVHDEDEEGIQAVVYAEFGEGLGWGVAVWWEVAERGDVAERGHVGEVEGR